jgi:hypothetical protein
VFAKGLFKFALCALGSLPCALPHVAAAQTAETEGSSRAVIVMIGEVGESDELADVLAELMEKSFDPHFVREESFHPEVFLAENERDARVWVFVTLHDPKHARLYFRGPHGERFLLRELELKRGLDEVGRESIAQIVETSVGALLNTSVGISREEAKAALAKEHELQTPPNVVPPPTTRPVDDEPRTAERDERRSSLELALRGVGRYGGPEVKHALAVGLEAGVELGRRDRGFVWRPRAVVERGFVHELTTTPIGAELDTWSFRLGVDAGFRSGPHLGFFGLAGGLDRVGISTKTSSDPTFTPTGKSSDIVPIVRLEARYELALSILRLGIAPFADVSLEESHYDLVFANETRRLATAWIVRPGLAVSIGISP